MDTQINLLKDVWEEGQRKALQNTELPKIAFEQIIGSMLSVGPFYFYVIDFFDMSMSNVSPSITDIHGFDPNKVTFDDILKTIHPDDMQFVINAEAANIDFLYNNIGKEHLLDYKANYSFRSKMKNGNYELLNHQAIVLTVDESGRFGKSLNIHTNIEHITSRNNNTFSLLSISDGPSYTNIEVTENSHNYIAFTPREIEIIRHIAAGKSSKQIAEVLFISEGTVKKHRTNIHQKSGCKNAVELVNKSLIQGLI